MARLTTIKPRLSISPPRLGRAPGDEQARLRERDRNVTWRKWYKTARWERLRQEILIRDNYTCRQTGVICAGKHPAPDSPVVDHVVPHRGDEALFWNPDNLQCVSKDYHDRIKQQMEKASHEP
ncbi:endonuclease [Rhizobium rhizosphaerae]|uniref:Endonuclease n=1 Tax=Xaviernesmea rhizosphaerae TaxID=1672749 RepID=A0A1Q9AMM4_9HYPH|nr:HNH endonuclease [Xaviernesmea rhizosphaerae]OLP56658.1 endonuclease [Xaviernesmea rhizosphaerae]